MIERNFTPIALAVLAAWVPLCGLLFIGLKPRVAVLAAFLSGYLFLPQGEMKVPGILPDLDRNVVVHCGVLLAIAAFDPRRLTRLRPMLIDLPVLLWCGVPLFSSMDNGLGFYDGLSGIMQRSIQYGIPYAIGRAYFADLPGLRQLAYAVVIGGLIYVPLCLFEVRMSPKLHLMLYGYHPHLFSSTVRLGGWRPMVFQGGGLALGMWMASASLLGVWLVLSGAVKKRQRTLVVPLVFALFVTTLLCKSLGSLVLLGTGLAALVAARSLGRAWPVLVLTLVPPTYVTLRASELWTGETAVAAVAEHVSPQRAQSLQFRFDNEAVLARKALERPLLGWGGYGRAQVADEDGKKRTIIDGLWIFALGENGMVGLLALGALFLLPVAQVCARAPAWVRTDPAAIGLATLVALWAIDSLLNAMFNPFAILALSGVSGLAALARRPAPALAPAPARRLAWA
jgi:hypothetical protein